MVTAQQQERQDPEEGGLNQNAVKKAGNAKQGYTTTTQPISAGGYIEIH